MPTPRRQAGDDINVRSAPQLLEYQSIVERLRQDSAGHTLDWGCGFGQVLDLLVRAGVDAVGFDYRPGIPTEAFVSLDHFPHLRAHISPDPVRLPFTDGSFDTVLSCGVLEHVEHPRASLAEIRRVLKPRGRFYVLKLPNRYSYLEWIAKHAGIYYHGALEHDRVYTKRTALELLEACSFQVVDFRRANMLPLTLDAAWATALARPIWAANRAIARVPGLNLLATNIELLAVRR